MRDCRPRACTIPMRMFGHRTLAEVNETEALWALADRGMLPPNKIKRLDSLSVRHEANNPPDDEKLPWSVA